MYASKMVKILINEEEKTIAFIIESENFVEITILPTFKKELDDEVGDLLSATYKFLMNSIPISERQEQGTNVFLQEFISDFVGIDACLLEFPYLDYFQ